MQSNSVSQQTYDDNQASERSARAALAAAEAQLAAAKAAIGAARATVVDAEAAADAARAAIESIAADPVDADVVHAAVGVHRGDPGAMLRSSDRGETWTRTEVPFRMGGNEDGRGLGERLAIDPNDNQILYFGSRHDGLQVILCHHRQP